MQYVPTRVGTPPLYATLVRSRSSSETQKSISSPSASLKLDLLVAPFPNGAHDEDVVVTGSTPRVAI